MKPLQSYKDLTGLLQMGVWEHLGTPGENYMARDQEFTFPGEESTGPTQLVHRVAVPLADGQKRRISVHASLAVAAVEIARTLHTEICNNNSPIIPGTPIACTKDARVVEGILAGIAARFLETELTDNTAKDCANALVQTGLTELEILMAVDAILAMGTRSLWDRRPKPLLLANTVTIQVNTAISHVTPDQFRTLRGLSVAIRTMMSDESRSFDVTSDYAHEENLTDKLVDEGLVLSAIFHTDAMIVFADHGRFGTAKAWARGEDLLMPVLVLSHVSDPANVARFPGSFALRTERTYETVEDVINIVRTFLEANAGHIRDRHRKLLDYATRDISTLKQLLDAADISTFDPSLLPWELVRFYLDNPVHWFQAPPEHREEIENRLGYIRPEYAPILEPVGPTGGGIIPPQRTGADVDDFHKSIRNLLRYAEIHQLPYKRVDQLTEIYRAEQALELQLSPRPGAYSVDDWRSLDRRTGGM